MSLTVEQITGFALKDDKGEVIAVYETQAEADLVKERQSAKSARQLAAAEIDQFNLYAGPNTYAINFDIEASGSLADLATALEQIRSDYGINPNT